MTLRAVRFLSTAEEDLASIYDWIVEATLHNDTAEVFIKRIIDRCEQLSDFPEMGVARDDLSSGIRMLVFEHRATIFYRIKDSELLIVNVFYRGRDYDDNTFVADDI